MIQEKHLYMYIKYKCSQYAFSFNLKVFFVKSIYGTLVKEKTFSLAPLARKPVQRCDQIVINHTVVLKKMPQAELFLEKGVTKVINIHNKHSINQFYIGEKYANLPYNHVYI